MKTSLFNGNESGNLAQIKFDICLRYVLYLKYHTKIQKNMLELTPGQLITKQP